MNITGVILRTQDVEGLTDFWGRRVGFEVTQTLPGYAFLDGDGVALTISAAGQPIDDRSWTEIVVGSEDVVADYAAMADRGVPFEGPLSEPIMSRDGKHLVAAHFQDPDGHYGRLTGWVEST